MKVLGLTGGVGMGKSTCAALLRDRRVPVIDTDELARQVVEPGQPAIAEVQNVFGREMVDSNGRLRRDVLARCVFADSAARQKLEAILHPRIRKLWQAQVQSWRSENLPLGVVVIPLLFETKAETELDAVICLACSNTTQFARLQARGWTPEHINQRIQAQLPIEDKIEKANYLIWTESGIPIHAAQLDRTLGLH